MVWEQDGAALRVGLVSWLRFRVEDAAQAGERFGTLHAHGRSCGVCEIGILCFRPHPSRRFGADGVAYGCAEGLRIAHGPQLYARDHGRSFVSLCISSTRQLSLVYTGEAARPSRDRRVRRPHRKLTVIRRRAVRATRK